MLIIEGLFILLFSNFLSGINSQVIIGEVEYGHPCKQRDDPAGNQADFCNLSNNLLCSEPSNTCACKSHMYFDEQSKKCIVYEGQACLEHVNDSQFPAICTPNAFCDQTVINVPGICKCLSPQFIPNQFGLCKLSHNSVGCNSILDCSLDAFLTCNQLNNTCGCDQINMSWDEARLKCVGNAYGNCDNDRRECIKGADCTNDKCICHEPEYINYSGICSILFGYSCLDDSECIGNLQCLTNPINNDNATQCQCEPGKYQQYVNACAYPLTTGLICEEDYPYSDRFNQCVTHATCQAVPDFQSWLCQCDNGYSETNLHNCLATFGTECSNTSDCNTDEGLVCDRANERCSCPPDFQFAEQSHKCLKIKQIGESCRTSEECVDSAICDTNYECRVPSTGRPDNSSSGDKQIGLVLLVLTLCISFINNKSN